MARKFAKGKAVKLSKAMDARKTGGPLIPQGTKGIVKKWEKFRGEVYIVEVEGFGPQRLTVEFLEFA